MLPADRKNLTVGISDNTAGHKVVSVPVTLTSKGVAGSGLSDTPLPWQTVTVTGNVYDYAVPASIVSPGNVGKVFRNTPVNRVLTVVNLAPESYSEGLDASFGAPSGSIAAAGSVWNLTGVNNTNLSLTLDTSTAGAKSGSVPVNLVSNGTNSGLASTELAQQWVSMSADVYDRGVASFDAASELNTLHLVLSGFVGETVAKEYNIYNLLQTAGFTGKLDLLDFGGMGDTTQLDSGLSHVLDLEAGNLRRSRQPWIPARSAAIPPSIPWTWRMRPATGSPAEWSIRRSTCNSKAPWFPNRPHSSS